MPEKTVLITGCSAGGLGEAMAKAYHARGFRVFATLRNTAKAGSLGKIEGIEVLELEVTSAESIARCAKAVQERTGGSLDVLVNNAGIAGSVPLLDCPIENIKKTFDTNVFAVLLMVQAFAPMLVKAKGTICNISSVTGEMLMAWTGAYSSSRAATTKLSEMLRIEMAPLGVRVVTAVLGGIETIGNDPSTKGDLELPQNSYYQKIWEILNRHHKALVFPKKENVDVAAKNIVSDVLSGRSNFTRHGVGSFMSWVGNTFLPYGLFVSITNGNAGLDQIGSA